MDKDVDILKTWIVDIIQSDKMKLKKAKTNKDYNYYTGRVIAFQEVVNMIDLMEDIEKRANKVCKI